MTEIVICKRHSVFGLSEAAVMLYAKLKGFKIWAEQDPKWKGLGLNTYWRVPPAERLEPTGEQWHKLSLRARIAYNKKYEEQTLCPRRIPRDDKDLVKVVKRLGKKADGMHAELAIVKIPRGVKWQIEEYDGAEWVAEQHRTWHAE